MRLILLINAIVEITAGIIIILFPELLLYDTPLDNLSFNISKMYGIGATIIGLFSFLIYRHGESDLLIKYASLAVIGFHLILSFHLFSMKTIGLLQHSGPMGFHVFLTLVTLFIYLKHIK
jgi:hypothetical protein